MSGLVEYWRQEAQHLAVAEGIKDEISVEYMTKARETADELERLRTVLTKVRDYNEGNPPYRFTGPIDQRANDAFDAWQLIRHEIHTTLGSKP